MLFLPSVGDLFCSGFSSGISTSTQSNENTRFLLIRCQVARRWFKTAISRANLHVNLVWKILQPVMWEPERCRHRERLYDHFFSKCNSNWEINLSKNKVTGLTCGFPWAPHPAVPGSQLGFKQRYSSLFCFVHLCKAFSLFILQAGFVTWCDKHLVRKLTQTMGSHPIQKFHHPVLIVQVYFSWN